MRPAINPRNITPFKIHQFGIKREEGYTEHRQENTYFVPVKHNFAHHIEDQNYMTPFSLQPTELLKLSYKYQCYGICHIGWVLAKVYVK